MFLIKFLLDCARQACGACTAQSSKKMMASLSENGYIHEFGFIKKTDFSQASLFILGRWLTSQFYYGSNKSTGKETGKTHLLKHPQTKVLQPV